MTFKNVLIIWLEGRCMKTNNVSFGKTYISKTYAINNREEKKEEFDFVEYDDIKNDEKILARASAEWTMFQTFGAEFARVIYSDFVKYGNLANRHYYGLENKSGEPKVLLKTKEEDIDLHNKHNKAGLKIAFMVTHPLHRHGILFKKYSKLGTSTFRALVKMAKEKGYDYITLKDVSGGFWNNIPYMEGKGGKNGFQTKILQKKDYDKCIKKLDRMI